MIFIQLDEVLIDRVGHAAGVFGYEIPKGVAFGMVQLAASLGMKRSEFYNLLDVANPDWATALMQPWAARFVGHLAVEGIDYRLLGLSQFSKDPLKYFNWVETKLGPRGLFRLVTSTAAIDPPMGPGDTLVDVSEQQGHQWKKRNGRFIQWQPYTLEHPQYEQQWMRVLSQLQA